MSDAHIIDVRDIGPGDFWGSLIATTERLNKLHEMLTEEEDPLDIARGALTTLTVALIALKAENEEQERRILELEMLCQEAVDGPAEAV